MSFADSLLSQRTVITNHYSCREADGAKHQGALA